MTNTIHAFFHCPSSTDEEGRQRILISSDELARPLSVLARALSRWHRLRKGPARIRAGNRLFYRVASVEAWLKRKEEHVSAQSLSRKCPSNQFQ